LKTNNDLIKHIKLTVQIRKVRYLNFVIIISIILIYLVGIYSGDDALTIKSESLSLFSIIACFILCITSIWFIKTRLKNLSEENFQKSFTTTYVISYLMCDIAGIMGIIANTFFSFNWFYATLSMVITIATLIFILPREKDYLFQ